MSRTRGPALVYIDSAGHRHQPARQAITDPVERALCGALLARADDLATKADTEAETPTRRPIGFAGQLTTDTERSGD